MSRRGPSRAEKKAARKRDRAETRASDSARWDALMVLEPDELRALLGHLDTELGAIACDHSLRLSRAWAIDRRRDWEPIRASLAAFGGGCDCEVLANVDPEKRLDTWARY